jgi:hypothetical protein
LDRRNGDRDAVACALLLPVAVVVPALVALTLVAVV